jgi:UDP-N-acetylglucosamine 2-epimerase (non-hydrolysing)
LLFRNATERNEGLNQNAILSHFNEYTVNQFVEHILDYSKSEITFEHAPSKIIVDTLVSISK